MYPATHYSFQQTITSTSFQNSSQGTRSLEQQIAERRLLLPVGKSEQESFKKSLEAWPEVLDKIQQLVELIYKLENLNQYDDSKYFTDELSKVNEMLLQLDNLITKYSDYCRCLPLKGEDALLIFYRNQFTLRNPKDSPIEAVYLYNKRHYLLESKNLPRDLKAVRTPLHFFALLENPYIKIQENCQNPSKTTFSLEQRSPGGMLNPGIPGANHIHKALNLVDIIRQALFLSSKLLEAIGLDLEAGPKNEGNQKKEGKSLKDVIGGGLIGGGGVALIMGSTIAVPAAVIVTGFLLVLKGSGCQEKINRMDEILSLIQKILEVLTKVPYLDQRG